MVTTPPPPTEGERHACGGSSTYIGRVGALAVALGIGSAVVTGHGLGLGVAYADDNTNGPDSFTYVASDGIAQSATVTVNITLVAVPDPPRTLSTGQTANVNEPTSIDLTGYAVDPDGDPLAFSTVEIITPNGNITVIASNLPPSGGGGDDLPDDPGGGGGVRV